MALTCGPTGSTMQQVITEINDNSTKITTNEGAITQNTADIANAAVINDTTPSATNVYSSQKVEAEFKSNPSVCTAWALIKGSDGSLLDTLNITSSRTGLGVLQVSFVTPMSSINYVISCDGGRKETRLGQGLVTYSDKTVNGFKIYTGGTNGQAIDYDNVSVIVFGGK